MRVGVREVVAAHDEDIVGEHELAPLDDEVGGRAFHRPDHGQDRLIEPAEAAVALVVEGIGAERNDDLPARHRQADAARAGAGTRQWASQNCRVRTSTDRPHGSAGGVVRQEQEVVVAAERVHARRFERTAGELPSLVVEVKRPFSMNPNGSANPGPPGPP